MQAASKHATTSRSHGGANALFAFYQPLARHVTWDDLAEDDFVIVPSRHDLQARASGVPLHARHVVYQRLLYPHFTFKSSGMRELSLHRLPPGLHHHL